MHQRISQDTLHTKEHEFHVFILHVILWSSYPIVQQETSLTNTMA